MADSLALIQDYLEWCQTVRRRSPETMRTYTSVLMAYCGWLEDQGLDVLTAQRRDMERFTLRPRDSVRGHPARELLGSPATRRLDVSVLRGFYRWVQEEGHSDVHLAIGLHGPKVDNENPKPVPDDVWRRVWWREMDDQLRVTLGLGYFVGLRRAEIVRLRAGDVAADVLVVKRKGGSQHTVPWRDMIEVVHERMPELVDTPELFAKPLLRLAQRPGRVTVVGYGSGASLYRRLAGWQRWMPRADRFSPHQLRHSCATNLLRAGVPLHLVSRLLNHSSPSITMRYVRAGGAELREWRGSNP